MKSVIHHYKVITVNCNSNKYHSNIENINTYSFYLRHPNPFIFLLNLPKLKNVENSLYVQSIIFDASSEKDSQHLIFP